MFIIKIKTAFQLGLLNILHVVLYKLSLKLSIHSVCFIDHSIPKQSFFNDVDPSFANLEPSSNWDKKALFFGHFQKDIENNPPNWFLNPFSGETLKDISTQWWKIPDFDSSAGDIKLIWEASRMDWVVVFAQRAKTGETRSLTRLNNWISDWLINNPPYFGYNWKCAQEASIRVINIACAAYILEQHKTPSQGIIELVKMHLKRIAPTLRYSISQNNNHGTSEAAALFIGGSLLYRSGYNKGKKWMLQGRSLLEERAIKLIEKDGSFSQYSTNYHRLMLDTYSFAELWRKEFKLEDFSKDLKERLISATLWIHNFVDISSGYVPNIGANDGARLLQLTDSSYKDFRPSVQLAAVLFLNKAAFADTGYHKLHLEWLRIKKPLESISQSKNIQFDNGGYAILEMNKTKVFMRYPRFRFRPSHADALHIDVWRNGECIFCDDGTYSYNSQSESDTIFSSTENHNTIMFDDRNQMMKISRFLFGPWLKTNILENINFNDKYVKFKSGYTDSFNTSHAREILLKQKSLKIIDKVSGFQNHASLYWRLDSGGWNLLENSKEIILENNEHRLSIESNVEISSSKIIKGWKSEFYMQKSLIDVLEIKINKSGTISSTFTW